jgi:4-hydroxybenzoate polyprenyltransferase
MKWLHFILSHSIFISLCAVALCFQTYSLLHLPGNRYIYGFIFFATLGSYNFYWLISKYSFSRKVPVKAFLKANRSYIFLFSFSGIGMAGCLWFLSGYYNYIALAIALTLLYSLPLWPFRFVSFAKKAGFLKTILLAATWAWVTVLVPAAPVLDTALAPVATLFLTRFCFMLMLCILFDMRDMKVDKIHSLHSLATDVSRRSLGYIMYIVFGLFIICGILVRQYFHDMPQMIAFAFTGLLVWIVYQLSLTKERGYFFYYFLVDGLMLISSAATYIAAI